MGDVPVGWLRGEMSGQAGAWAAMMHSLIFSDPRVVEKRSLG